MLDGVRSPMHIALIAVNPLLTHNHFFFCKTVHKNFTTLKKHKIYQPEKGMMSNTSLSMKIGFSPSQTNTFIPKEVKPTLSSTNRTIPLDFFSFIRR